MTYAIFEDERYYICHDGRELRHIRTESKEQDDFAVTVAKTALWIAEIQMLKETEDIVHDTI